MATARVWPDYERGKVGVKVSRFSIDKLMSPDEARLRADNIEEGIEQIDDEKEKQKLRDVVDDMRKYADRVKPHQ